MIRRQFLAAAGAAVLRSDWAARAQSTAAYKAPPAEAAHDEDFWREIQAAFAVDRNIINLNNGAVSPSPRVVQDAVRRYQEFSNMAPAHNMWRVLEPELENVRARLARTFGCDPEELAITRNATEALETCQLGLDLKRGDEVLTTDQDYPRMLTAWRQRERRDGIVVKYVEFPVPAPSLDDLYQRFERAVTPRTRVILFCHITFTTGQIFPVKRICEMARARGIETIVDGAHAFAQFPFRASDLGCDYYGTSLHKWLVAPHGTGFLYVRREKIAKLWPLLAAEDSLREDIRKFEQFGTHPAASHNAIAEALTLHESIGGERKAARLRYLRSLWEDRLKAHPRVRLLTSRDPAESCGLGTFSVEGINGGVLANRLWDKHRILVSSIAHGKQYEGVRVTPSIYSTVDEIDIFCGVMEKILREG
ncbi:MAG TPA: aminotransferase class V-fold PLP-dependent enzyme [Bryobacteraceae bacterium]|nr:aminotransferase class V-fold PLP-dependent enzyme [Bryobacteraceae bacterium]